MYVSMSPGGRTQSQVRGGRTDSLYGMYQFIWHLLVYMAYMLVYTACVSLYGMCQFIRHVSVYMACYDYVACVNLYIMCQFIWHVLDYMACISLYGIH